MVRLKKRRVAGGSKTWITGAVAALIAAAAGGQPAAPLLTPAELIAAPPSYTQGPEASRWRPVRLAATARDALRRGDDLALEIFDRTLAVSHTRTIHNPSGSLSWIGSVPGDEGSLVVLVSRGGVAAGSIRTGGRLFMLLYAGRDADGGAVHALVEIDERAERFRHHCEPTAPAIDPGRLAAAERMAQRMAEGAPQDDGSIQDLMVVYTPMALADLGGSVTAVENLIDLGVTETNMSYETSGVDHRLRLVHTALTDFDELEQTGIDARDHLQDPDDGYMDEVHPLRDLHRADLVKLLTSRGCGRAFIMDVVSLAHAEFAFCRTSVVCVSPGYTFAHELGHVAAGRHQRPFAVDGSPFTFNFGYIDVANRFRTIMAAGESACPDGCPRRMAWSNPDGLDAATGAPMGVPEGDPEAADLRKTLNATAWVVANFRVSDSVLFGDGFETGDFNAWSGVVPTP